MELHNRSAEKTSVSSLQFSERFLAANRRLGQFFQNNWLYFLFAGIGVELIVGIIFFPEAMARLGENMFTYGY